MGKNQFDIPDEAYTKLVAQTEAFFVGAGNLLKDAYNGPAPKPADGPFMLSYPPAHDEETALDNARQGYGLEGIRGGRILGDDFLAAKLKALPGILARAELASIPPAMVEFGWLTNLTEFQDIAGLGGSPFPYATENFGGKALSQHILEYWASKAAPGGGLPSGPKG